MRAYYETWHLPITITNCSNNYGPFQFPEKVIPLFVTNALEDLPLPMYASTQNRREWLHVLDHCRAIELDPQRRSDRGDLQRRHGCRDVDRADRRHRAPSHGKPESLKTIVPDRPGHDRRYVLDWSKIEHELGWADGDRLGGRDRRDGRLVRGQP